MDVVYILGPSIWMSNQELRYSLRSLRHLNHSRVHFVGAAPEWAANVNYIYNRQRGTKYDNSRNNITVIANHPDISDDFILMNDDFFILEPFSRPPLFNRGPLATLLDTKLPFNNYWIRGKNALDALTDRGIANPLCFETHTPAVLNKTTLKKYLDDGSIRPDQFLRTMYFNLTGEQGTFRFDVKIDDFEKGYAKDFVSTSDRFGRSHQFFSFIQQRFPLPCYYEGA